MKYLSLFLMGLSLASCSTLSSNDDSSVNIASLTIKGQGRSVILITFIPFVDIQLHGVKQKEQLELTTYGLGRSNTEFRGYFEIAGDKEIAKYEPNEQKLNGDQRYTNGNYFHFARAFCGTTIISIDHFPTLDHSVNLRVCFTGPTLFVSPWIDMSKLPIPVGPESRPVYYSVDFFSGKVLPLGELR